MAWGIWSEFEPAVELRSVEDLDRFIDDVEAKCTFPVALTVEVHDYRADLLVGHEMSFVHLSPEDPDKQRYFVTIGNETGELVDLWLHSLHHTQFESRHLIPKRQAREALREFFQTGRLLPTVLWEKYDA